MHPSSHEMMSILLKKYLASDQPLRILDVGSQDVNGSYRSLVLPPWTYTGCDLIAGRNVDIVQTSPYRIQQEGGLYDVVISGQCLEHVEEPWLLVPEMARMLRLDGICILEAPWQYVIHRFPLDCWRVLPDGMGVLLRLAGLTPLEPPFINGVDCWGIAQKK